jgi:hypothetical protein
VGGGFHSYVLHGLEAHNILFETMADHGFIGLGLFLLLIVGTMVNLQRLSKRARQVPELEWAVDLGAMLQLSLVTFMAGSQFLSDATYSLPYEIAALSMAARGIVERRLAQERRPLFTAEWPAPIRPSSSPVTPAPAMAFGQTQSLAKSS